jgi:hypothetical protein
VPEALEGTTQTQRTQRFTKRIQKAHAEKKSCRNFKPCTPLSFGKGRGEVQGIRIRVKNLKGFTYPIQSPYLTYYFVKGKRELGKKGIRERGNLSIREMGIRARSLMSFSLLSLKAPKRAIPEFDKGEFAVSECRGGAALLRKREEGIKEIRKWEITHNRGA